MDLGMDGWMDGLELGCDGLEFTCISLYALHRTAKDNLQSISERRDELFS